MAKSKSRVRSQRYDATAFPPFAVTVDVVVFTLVDAVLQVLLVRRGAEPYRGAWALPGGFKKTTETLETAALRELSEETGVALTLKPTQLRAYGDPARDPRMDVVTVAFVAVMRTIESMKAGTDAAEAGLHPVEDVLSGRLELAFDHLRIVKDAVGFLGRQLEISDLVTAFLESPFTLSTLRIAYESVWNTRLDAANFRRKLIGETGWLVPTGRYSAPGAAGGKPAELYRLGKAWRDGGPIRRPTGTAIA